MLKVGDQAPLEIKVKSMQGQDVSLKDLLGKYVVVYFYPRDNTPGCTKEACSFRDVNTELKKLGVKVIGVSKDSVKSHQKFIDKYGLNFELWSDEEHKLIEAFGAWQEKKFMGRSFMGTVRSTFVIDPQGKIFQVWEKVKPDGHGEEVLKLMKETLR